MANVRVALGRTINLGDFNSQRIDIEIEDTNRPDESNGELFNRVYNAVEAQLNAKLTENGLA